MPNAISPTKQSFTYLEDIAVFDWMARVAQERKTDVSVILREASAAYYAQFKNPAPADSLFAVRTASKARQRARTAAQISSGALTPEAAQQRNAPIIHPVRVTNLWPSIRRFARAST